MKQILKKINFLKVAEVIMVGVIVLLPVFAAAQLVAPDCPPGVRCNQETSLTQLIKTVINYMLAFAGLISLVFLIIGGFQYITSAGNEEAAEKGKGTVVNAIIGLVIIGLSFVMVNVVIKLIQGNNPTV